MASCWLHSVNGLSSQKSFHQTVSVEPIMARSAIQVADRSFAEDGFRMTPPFIEFKNLTRQVYLTCS
jgi:hypothetical protein